MDVYKKSGRLTLFCLVTLVAAMIAGPLRAQNVNVTGKVSDNNGAPLMGVYVLVQGTSRGVSTDIDGTYAINAPADGTLMFSFMGFENVAEQINRRSIIDVSMTVSSVALEELVVTALGIKKDRKALGFSVTEVGAEELLKNKQTNVINSLAGKVAGVNVTQSGGSAGSGSTIIIRGGNSASEGRDNQPLFVVDGIIYDNSTVIGGNSGTDGMTKLLPPLVTVLWTSTPRTSSLCLCSKGQQLPPYTDHVQQTGLL